MLRPIAFAPHVHQRSKPREGIPLPRCSLRSLRRSGEQHDDVFPHRDDDQLQDGRGRGHGRREMQIGVVSASSLGSSTPGAQWAAISRRSRHFPTPTNVAVLSYGYWQSVRRPQGPPGQNLQIGATQLQPSSRRPEGVRGHVGGPAAAIYVPLSARRGDGRQHAHARRELVVHYHWTWRRSWASASDRLDRSANADFTAACARATPNQTLQRTSAGTPRHRACQERVFRTGDHWHGGSS